MFKRRIMLHKNILWIGVLLLCIPSAGIAQSYSFVVEDVTTKVGLKQYGDLREVPGSGARDNLIGRRFSVELVGTSYARISLPWVRSWESLLLVHDGSSAYWGEIPDQGGILALEFNRTLGRITRGVLSLTTTAQSDRGEEMIVQIVYDFARR